MAYEIPELIEGPAILQLGQNFYESRADIKLSLSDEKDERRVITRGKVGDKLKGRKLEVKFTPVKWSDFSSLFKILSMTPGQFIFGTQNQACCIYGLDGKKFTMPRSAITGIPAIGAGVSKDLLGEFTITSLVDPTKAYSDLASLISITNAAMPALPSLVAGDLASGAFRARFGDIDNPADDDFDFDMEEGADIEFDLKTTERKMDRLGIFDYKFNSLGVKAKYKPVVSVEQWQQMVSLITSPNLGGIIEATKDLLIYGMALGNPKFLLRKITCGERGLTWGEDPSRIDEVNVEAMGNMGLNKFTVGTVAAEDLAA